MDGNYFSEFKHEFENKSDSELAFGRVESVSGGGVQCLLLGKRD